MDIAIHLPHDGWFYSTIALIAFIVAATIWGYFTTQY